MQNRHPADRLADVRSEIKRLEAEEANLRGQMEAISSELRMYARTKHRGRTAVSVVSALLRFLVAWAPVRGVVILRKTFARRRRSRTNDH